MQQLHSKRVSGQRFQGPFGTRQPLRHAVRPLLRPVAASAASQQAAAATTSSSAAAGASGRTCVVLTREAGKNGKMARALGALGFDCLELPLIEHAAGPDKDRLPELLKAGGFDWVAITSPEAAAVFLEGWEAAGKPQVRVAVVGGGTGEVLLQGGVTPEYTSSKALGKTMGGELPKVPGGNNHVLYPASVKAGTDLQSSLEASGFTVTRIHTYNTTGVKSVESGLLERAKSAAVITYGSPSAVKAWVALAGVDTANRQVNACIGSTSAKACAAAGITANVAYPDAPGIEGWVECVVGACKARGILPPAPTH